MDLWIRSQDRTKLICCNDIAITTYSEDGKAIGGYKIVGYFDKNTEYENLGFYTLRERALEVLDEIQKLLKPIYKVKNEFKKSELTGNCNWEQDMVYIPIQTKVYEMPKV